MIYEKRNVEDPLYQGDIFSCIPLPEFSILEDLATAAQSVIKWEEHVKNTAEPLAAVVQLRPVMAMVISQDCEIARDDGSVTLALVDKFTTVHRGLGTPTPSPATVQKHVTRLSKVNLQWFYLPACAEVGFTDRMATDFETTMRLDVADLLSWRKFRVAGLIEYAREHLRHRIGYFFQRYPVDEWYALDSDELKAYQKDGHPDASPYPWQPQEEEAE